MNPLDEAEAFARLATLDWQGCRSDRSRVRRDRALHPPPTSRTASAFHKHARKTFARVLQAIHLWRGVGTYCCHEVVEVDYGADVRRVFHGADASSRGL